MRIHPHWYWQGGAHGCKGQFAPNPEGAARGGHIGRPEKNGACPGTPRTMDWQLVDVVAGFFELLHGSPEKYWATMDSLRALRRPCGSPSEWEVASLAAISMSLGLHAKEAVSVAFNDGMFTWRGAKSRAGHC